MGRTAQGARWRRACTAVLAAWVLAWSGVQAFALASSSGPVRYSPATPATLFLAHFAIELARLEPSPGSAELLTALANAAAVPVAVDSSSDKGASGASASAQVTIRVPAAVRLSVLADGSPPVTARAVQEAAGAQAAQGAGSLSASVAARMRTAATPQPVEVRIFANTPWALFVRMGEGPAGGVQLKVQEMRSAAGSLPADPTGPGATGFTLLPQGPGKLLVRSQQPGVTVLRLQVATASVDRPSAGWLSGEGQTGWPGLDPAAGMGLLPGLLGFGPLTLRADPGRTGQALPELPAASEVQLWFHLVSLGSGSGG